MKLLFPAVIALVGATVLLASANPASAGTNLTICNKTSAVLHIAVGYHSSGVNDSADSKVLTGPFVSRGFTSTAPGKCDFFTNPFSARYMFWWATDQDVLNAGMTVWAGTNEDHFCIPNTRMAGPIHPFTFEVENRSEDACTHSQTSTTAATSNNSWVRVRRVDLMVDPTVTFYGQ
jgi:uncharacterized membrane protein